VLIRTQCVAFLARCLSKVLREEVVDVRAVLPLPATDTYDCVEGIDGE
jgi:hypothetical protein